MLNQVRMGLRIPQDEIVAKPAELIKYEQMKSTGLNVWAGGLQDQPHLWLMIVGEVKNLIDTWESTLANAGE